MRHIQTPNTRPQQATSETKAFWSAPPAAVTRELEVDAARGLAESEVLARRDHYGPNQLKAVRPRRVTALMLDQFKSVVILLLCFAALLALLFGDRLEGAAIIAVVLVNTAIGFFTEWRATRSMEALRRLGQVDMAVRRGGAARRIPAQQLVPGDIVLVEGGDIIAADIRLLECSGLQADESALTGESLPVAKQAGALPASTPLQERSNLLFKGTVINCGSGLGVVVVTGAATELGQIAQLVSEAEAQETPLEKRLDALGRRLVWVMLAVAVLIAAGGIIAGRDTVLAIQVAVALMIAAIPEGLPVVATIALARGMWRMARRNALIVRLSAVETLGATGVVLTDKTGTLTENRMTVTAVLLAGHALEVTGTGLDAAGGFLEAGQEPESDLLGLLDCLLRTLVLCNNASVQWLEADGPRVVGDPTEIALLVAAAKRGLRRDDLLRQYPEVREVSFSTETKSMATFNRGQQGLVVSVKGAPESVLRACSTVRTSSGDQTLTLGRREAFLASVEQLASQGLRTLAVASRQADSDSEDPYGGLVLLGAIGLSDPARSDVREAIAQFHDAGIRVVMVTGDHASTARRIAQDIQLIGADATGQCLDAARLDGAALLDEARLSQVRVIARATPQQKLELISYYQDQGWVVAMTGDGVNDAPALKQADIGVAMGIRGTPVAREAAAMVLQDDRFSTILEAVAQGRAIYASIRKFVVYLLSCNISEVLVVGLAIMAGAPLPLLPLQILFLNLVTDVFPALALGVGEGPAGLMSRAPRPANEPILARRHWVTIASYGAVMSAAVLGAMGIAVLALGFPADDAVTVSFCTLALAQLWHVFNMRDRKSAALRNEITTNPWIWAAVILCIILVLAAVYVPAFSLLLGLVNPGLKGWAVILPMSLVPLLFAPLIRALPPGSD